MRFFEKRLSRKLAARERDRLRLAAIRAGNVEAVFAVQLDRIKRQLGRRETVVSQKKRAAEQEALRGDAVTVVTIRGQSSCMTPTGRDYSGGNV